MSGSFPKLPARTPAQEDLLRVMRAAVNGQVAEIDPLAWPAVYRLAAMHQVETFLYPLIRAWPPAALPPEEMMHFWRTVFLQAAGRYARVAEQARELFSALHAAGIEMIPLKGVWLAERIYMEGGCRTMNDIDLLVPEARFNEACGVIRSIGYVTPDYDVTDRRVKHAHFQKCGEPLALELHRRLFSHPVSAGEAPSTDWVWHGNMEDRLHGIPVQTFAPERQVAYLAHHILGHRMAVPLKVYLDLCLVCERFAAPLSDTAFRHERARWGAVYGISFVLRMADRLLKSEACRMWAAIPEESAELCEALDVAEQIVIGLDAKSIKLTSSLSRFIRSKGLERIRIGLASLFRSAAEMRQIYPRTVRWFGLAGGYLWRLPDLFLRHGSFLSGSPSCRRQTKVAHKGFEDREQLIAWLCARENDTKGHD